MDPASTTGAWAKVVATIKDWPTWLFAAVAISLTVFLIIPAFHQLVSASTYDIVLYAAAVAWIFVLTRAGMQLFEALRLHYKNREASRRFVITPVQHQCFWGVSKQPDGSLVTQISCSFMIKNRSAEPLYLMSAHLLKPKISGEVLQAVVLTRAPEAAVYGTPHVSGYSIPPGVTLPVSATILIRGSPRHNKGALRATIEIRDADEHQERIKVQLRNFGHPPPG